MDSVDDLVPSSTHEGVHDVDDPTPRPPDPVLDQEADSPPMLDQGAVPSLLLSSDVSAMPTTTSPDSIPHISNASISLPPSSPPPATVPPRYNLCKRKPVNYKTLNIGWQYTMLTKPKGKH